MQHTQWSQSLGASYSMCDQNFINKHIQIPVMYTVLANP